MTADTTAPDLDTASDDDLKAMGLPPRFTLDSLKDYLSEEEIDALSEGDDPLLAKADGDDDDDDDGLDEDDEAAAKPDAEGDEAGDDAPPPPADDTPDPVIQPPDVTEHKAVLDTYKDERAKLRESYSDGEMTDDEYDAALDALNDKVAEAKVAIKAAEIDIKSQQAAYADAWYAKAAAKLDANPVLKDAAPVAALDGYSVAQLFDEACRHVNANPQLLALPMAQRLEAAEQITRDFYRQKVGSDLPGTAPRKGGKPALPTPREMVEKQGKRPPAPQTLATVSAASETDVQDSRWAAVDNAKGLDAEAAFARMSPAEQEAYLNAR